MTTLAFRFGRRVGSLLQYYPARLAVNLAYKMLFILIAVTFPGALATGGLWYLGVPQYYAAAVGGAVGLLVLLSLYPNREQMVQMLLGWPRR